MRSTLVPRISQAVLLTAVAGASVVLTAGVALAAPSASGSPTTGLKNGSSVAIKGAGWAAGATLYIVECANSSGQGGCDTGHLKTATVGADGAFTASFAAETGKVGNGTCAAGSTNCFIAVSDGTATNYAPIKLSFAGAAAAPAPAAAPAAPAPAAATPDTAGAAPTSVAAGSGGLADRSGTSTGVLALVGLGGAAAIGGTVLVARRRRESSEA
jgi:hypothetical protein